MCREAKPVKNRPKIHQKTVKKYFGVVKKLSTRIADT